MNYLKFGLLLLLFYLFGCIEKSQTQFEALSSPAPELLDRIEPLIQPSIDFAHRNEQYAFENGVELTAEEKKLQRELYDSITPETIQELGPNEMYAKVRKDYYGHPDAKGYEEKK